jgi:hypothetical protein
MNLSDPPFVALNILPAASQDIMFTLLCRHFLFNGLWSGYRYFIYELMSSAECTARFPSAANLRSGFRLVFFAHYGFSTRCSRGVTDIRHPSIHLSRHPDIPSHPIKPFRPKIYCIWIWIDESWFRDTQIHAHCTCMRSKMIYKIHNVTTECFITAQYCGICYNPL